MLTGSGPGGCFERPRSAGWNGVSRVVDREKLSSRLDALESYVAELRGFREIPREEFVREPSIHHLAERYLHLACESVLDIARHVIADQGYRQAASNRNAIEVLAGEGLLDPMLSERLQGWMGLRNVLVHFYLEIDHGRTFDAIEQDLGDLDAFAARMVTLLRS
jgi:uncharacterized protein YutE (UPF0331/DUF86 family)